MRILFLTGSRSEWGYIRPILREIERHPGLEYRIVVTNMHLLPTFGSSVREIEEDGFEIAERIHMVYDGYTGLTMTKSLATLLSELPSALDRHQPDFALLAGDRGEQLMGAVAALHAGVPVAHVQAGELSGNVDGVVRHALTKLSHLHFAANAEFAERVRRLGEEEFRIHVTGAPLTDELVDGDYDHPKAVAERFRIDPTRPLVLLVQHPVTEQESAAGPQMDETLAALRALEVQTIAIAPNSDAGSAAIRERLAGVDPARVCVVENLRRREYLGLLCLADAIVGNSSSGLLEAPTFGTPCVNIGRRQHRRLQSTHVINADHSRREIAAAVRTALTPRFVEQARKAINPYGNGGAARRIVEILKRTPRDERLFDKEVTF